MSQQLFGIAVVGAGNMGRRHMGYMKDIPWFKIQAVADTNVAAARRQAEAFGIAVWTDDYRRVVAQPDVDVVFVCTPTAYHAEVAIEAARHGKHIFCEKPLALKLPDGLRVVQAVEQAGVTLAINFKHRFQKSHQLMRKWFLQGDLGRPIYYTINSMFGVFPNLAMYDNTLNGGPLLDMLCHFLDTWRFLFESEPVRVFARSDRLGRNNPILAALSDPAADTVAVTVEFESGDVGSYNFCWGLPKGTPAIDRHYICAPGAAIEFTPFSRLAISRDGRPFEIFDDLEVNVDQEQLRHFAAAIRDDRPPGTDVYDGLAALKVSAAALESARTGQAVQVE